jgi:hypothetical protein
MEVNFGDGHGHIDANGKSGGAGKQADEDEDTAEKFGKGGKVGAPGGQTQAGDELNVVGKSAEDLVVTVCGHDGAQGEPHNEKSEGLQAIKVTQVISSEETIEIDYSSLMNERKWAELRPRFHFGTQKTSPRLGVCRRWDRR